MTDFDPEDLPEDITLDEYTSSRDFQVLAIIAKTNRAFKILLDDLALDLHRQSAIELVRDDLFEELYELIDGAE